MTQEYPNNAEHEHDRLGTLAQRFFLAWAEKHAEEVTEYGVLAEHPSQDIDVAKTEALMPDEGEGPKELAGRIRQIAGMSFEGNAELAADFFNALDAPYPYEGGDGRTYLDVLDQDYLSQREGVSVILGHLDNGLSDVPRATGLLRTRLLEAYGDKYLDKVGEIASNTVAYETIYGMPTPDVLSLLRDVYYVVPNTESIHAILSRSGLSLEEYEAIKRYINNRAVLPIARDLHDGHLIVSSATGTRAKLTPSIDGRPAELTMPQVDIVSARLITSGAKAIWPVAIVENRIGLGAIKPVVKGFGKEVSPDDRHVKLLEQVEGSMVGIADLANSIFESTGTAVVARYSSAAEPLHK